MPADYASAARALSIPVSPNGDVTSPTSPKSPRSSHATSPGPLPPWARSAPHGPSRRGTRRLSTPYARNNDHLPLSRRILQSLISALNKVWRLFLSLSPVQRVAAVIAGLAASALGILFLVFSHRIFSWLEPVAVGWRELPAGWLIIFLFTCIAAFPPMIGYSTCLTIAGFVWGFPKGWPIVASATVVGSTLAFLASRTIFSSYVHALVGTDKRFLALGQVLRHDGVFVLAAIRLCPLPFSLSNGFLATIPNISPWTFALATAMASPKILIHIFIGSRLAKLAESGDEMTVADKAVNYVFMILSVILGTAIGLFIYRRTMGRAEELMRDDPNGTGPAAHLRREADLADYEDLEEGLVNAGRRRFSNQDAGGGHQEDSAALMDDDDISLWETDGVAMALDDDLDLDATANGSYRDDTDGEEAEEEAYSDNSSSSNTRRKSSRRGGGEDGELPRPDVFDV